MQDDTNLQPPHSSLDDTQDVPVLPPAKLGGQRVIQPSTALIQELSAQQQELHNIQSSPQSGVAETPSMQPVVVNLEPTIPDQSATAAKAAPELNLPSQGDIPFGMSASQMGLNHPTPSRRFVSRRLIIKTGIGFVLLAMVCAVLLLTHIIPFSQFKTVSYTSSGGAHYSFSFYTAYTTKTLQSGSTQLVSKVSEGGKFPLALSISSGPLSELDSNGIKGCTGSLPKVFDVQNDNLKQQLSVCSALATTGPSLGVYILGFAANNQANIVTISQDLSGVDLSSSSAAQHALPKFGLDPYQDDITKIVASIKVN